MQKSSRGAKFSAATEQVIAGDGLLISSLQAWAKLSCNERVKALLMKEGGINWDCLGSGRLAASTGSSCKGVISCKVIMRGPSSPMFEPSCVSTLKSFLASSSPPPSLVNANVFVI